MKWAIKIYNNLFQFIAIYYHYKVYITPFHPHYNVAYDKLLEILNINTDIYLYRYLFIREPEVA